MTPAQFRSSFDRRCRTNSTMFDNTNFGILARQKQIEIAQAIETVDEDYFCSYETTDLKQTTTDPSTREYALPEDNLGRMKLVEAKLDGTNWVQLKETDLNLYDHATDETTIRKYFTNEEGVAAYDIARMALFLFTGEIEDAVEDGLRWIGFSLPKNITDWTDTTTDLSAPNTNQSGIPVPFQGLWLDACVIDWKQSHDKPIALTESEQQFQYNLQQKLMYAKGLNRDRDNLMPLPDTGTNNGWDL